MSPERRRLAASGGGLAAIAAFSSLYLHALGWFAWVVIAGIFLLEIVVLRRLKELNRIEGCVPIWNRFRSPRS